MDIPPQPLDPKERTIRDTAGTVWRLWEVEPRPGRYGTSFCLVVFVSEGERRYKPFLRGALACEHHNSLVVQLGGATVLPVDFKVPGPAKPALKSRAFTTGDFEEGA